MYPASRDADTRIEEGTPQAAFFGFSFAVFQFAVASLNLQWWAARTEDEIICTKLACQEGTKAAETETHRSRC